MNKPTTLSPAHATLESIATPALVVDGRTLERNIERMAETARRAGRALRPHAKTHKSKEIAALQLRAGAVGIACATVSEAEALAAAGVTGLLITSPAVGADRLGRIVKLNREADVTIVADHMQQVAQALALLQPGDPPLRMVVDVDVGQARTGVSDLAAGMSLAKTIAGNGQLRFAGIQGYAGHIQHIVDAAERKSAAAKASAVLQTFATALQAQDLQPGLISGSGTGTHGYDLAGPYTELQVGSYVFMDADYARVVDERGDPPPFSSSLFVLATVVSVNRPGEVTVDAGTKALATNGPPPCVILGAPPGSTYKFAGDEHGIIGIPPGAQAPGLGERLLIGATHCDPTVNLHSTFHVIRDDGVEKWAILGRY